MNGATRLWLLRAAWWLCLIFNAIVISQHFVPVVTVLVVVWSMSVIGKWIDDVLEA